MGNSLISRVDLAINGRINEFQSLEPRKSINLESPKRISVKKIEYPKIRKKIANLISKLEHLMKKTVVLMKN